jgi:hypothetical protein
MNGKEPIIVLGQITVGINIDGDVAVDVRGKGQIAQIPGIQEVFDRATAAFMRAFAEGKTPTGMYLDGNLTGVTEIIKAGVEINDPLSATDVSE